MPGSTTFLPTASEDKIATTSDPSLMSRQPPPVAPRTTSVSIQSWQSATTGGDANRHARSASMDSLESSGSSSSGGGSSIANHRSADGNTVEYIPTRSVGKKPKLPSHNPLQFVKVQSPLYKKAEHQIKLTKEVKVTREALKEGEEEWQSNLDNWKSRRRKVSEKVIQRAEEMRQIEAEEQLRQEQFLQQQRKIKKFSEIVEKRSTSRYNLDLYIGQGDDSGLGGTPEPDDTLDNQNSILRSDTSEGMTSEAESIDSDIHKFDKINEKEPPKVPQKPQSRLKREKTIVEIEDSQTTIPTNNFPHLSPNDLSSFDNFSSTEPSDIEGHAGDSETISSEDDISYLSDGHKSQSDIQNICNKIEDNCNGMQFKSQTANINLLSSQLIQDKVPALDETDFQNIQLTQSFSLCIKPGDNRGFGFSLKGGKDQGCAAYVDNITKYGPAETMGLKEGDKIISLNGELATECSHASLIFTVKQAVYTGILDIIIHRIVKDAPRPEVIPKSTNKKSSFAEKLALFSSGVKSTSGEENKSLTTSSKSEEVKSESLVLRRRSAFENGKNESNVVYRRSSCLSQGSPSVLENAEKRLSGDLTLAQFNQENGLGKKGPPPPVPVKPKLKLMSNVSQKPESTKVNGCKDNLNIMDVNQSSRNESFSLSSNENLTNEHAVNGKVPNSENITDLMEENHEDDKSLHHGLTEKFDAFHRERNFDTVDYLRSYNSITCSDFNSSSTTNSTSETIEFISSKVSDIALEENPTQSPNKASPKTEFVPSNVFNEEGIVPPDDIYIQDTDQVLENASFTSSNVDHVTELIDSWTLQHETEATSSVVNYAPVEIPNYELENEETEMIPDDTSLLLNSEVNVIDDNIVCESSFVEECEQADPVCDFAQNDRDSNSVANPNTLESLYESKEIYEVPLPEENLGDIDAVDNIDYFENNLNTVDETDENMDNIQSNPSPLCLPLEKIDEDDVISASTTTSSETPDTETVIETLPSNLSPLPNDESNGEDSSKPLSCQDKELENPMQISVNTYSNVVASSADDLPENLSENIPINGTCSSEDYIKEDNGYIYSEDQDDEYSRELDESIDQITCLDVIDEIEQRLMHQLEQQDETYEGMDECLTAQLEQDINKQWLYLSEEAELLHDLTPRNMEPPREPPPPPPPPEADIAEIPDAKIMPMVRTNSTKRIKKELWRRRSDFLGLDSPEGIDVDNILPPPPGLEEILKQEREQNQWLEKRLSLAETDISAPVYSKEPIHLASQDFTTHSDFSSEYFLEDMEENPVSSLDGHSENWKDNLDKDTTYDNDFQYITPADVTSPSSEETSKISESPQHKAKQNLHNLGAAPKAKIMDSNKWITEKISQVNKKSIEPVFSQTTYNQNYWLAQDDERKRSVQCSENLADRRYSMPQFSNLHPDVTVRTWGDRENEFQKQRPRSAVWESPGNGGDYYDTYSHSPKHDVMRTHSLDSHREVNCDTNILESEVHNCSCCGKGLCEGSAMGIEALRLYFHIECFRCCLCHMQLGNGLCGTDVQVKNNQLFCPRCFTVD